MTRVFCQELGTKSQMRFRQGARVRSNDSTTLTAFGVEALGYYTPMLLTVTALCGQTYGRIVHVRKRERCVFHKTKLGSASASYV